MQFGLYILIGAVLGYSFSGGSTFFAILGGVVGYLYYTSMQRTPRREEHAQQQHSQQAHFSPFDHLFTAQDPLAPRNFFSSLMVLTAYVVDADGRIMHSEMEHVRAFLRSNFGERGVVEGEALLRQLFERQRQLRASQGTAAYERMVEQGCGYIRQQMSLEGRLQLVAFLADITRADGRVDEVEVKAVHRVALSLGLTRQQVESLFHLGEDTIEAAYAVLEISPSATDDEVKRAYKRLALQHHPDRVATLGEEVRKAAERKFQEIGAAKDRIYKARGMK